MEPSGERESEKEKKQGRNGEVPKRNLKLVIEFKTLYLTETVNYQFGSEHETNQIIVAYNIK